MLPDPRLLSYDSYDLPDAESEREIVRIFFFRSFRFDLPNGVGSQEVLITKVSRLKVLLPFAGRDN